MPDPPYTPVGISYSRVSILFRFPACLGIFTRLGTASFIQMTDETWLIRSQDKAIGTPTKDIEIDKK